MFGPVMTSSFRCTIELEVVCDERRVNDLFDDQVAATGDFNAGLVDDLRFGKSQCFRALGEGAENIEFRESCCRGLQ